MRRSESGSVVAVKILVEQDMVAPMRVFLELPRAAIERAPAGSIRGENADQPIRDFAGHLGKGDLPAVLAREWHGVCCAVCLGQLVQGFNQQKTGRKPDRPAPVRIASFDLRDRLGRLVADEVTVELERLSLVSLGQTADAIV